MLNPHWLNLLCHSCSNKTVLAGLLGKLRHCKVHIHQARLHLLCGNLSVQGLVSLDLSKDTPVIKCDDGLLKWMKVSVVAPEVGTEPVGEGFKGPVIKGWCSKEVNDISIMLASCHGAKSCHSSVIQLLDEDSRTLPIWTGDSKYRESSIIVLKSIRAQQQLSINVLYTLFESMELSIDVCEVFSEVVSLTVVYLLSLL